MILVQHRVNKLNELMTLAPGLGAEVDIRYHENQLVLAHDPYNHHLEDGLTQFESFLKEWTDNLLILNVKTEGIEKKCIELMHKYKFQNWFFLDLSMPFFVKYALSTIELDGPLKKENLAVRFSDKEPIEYALAFAGKSSWVWVDWFDTIVLTFEKHKSLKEHGFKVCLVSPELQGKQAEEISAYRQWLESQNIVPDAVCTKRPDLWS